MALNPHHLSLLDEVARQGSITAAASALGITQPAVSRQIKQLERSLSVRLIERSPRGVSLTAAGSVLAGYARKAAALYDEAEAAVADLQSLRRGTLAIAASPTIATYLLPAVLVRYRLKYPGIRLAVSVERSPEIYKALRSDEPLDVAFTEVEPADASLSFNVFMRDELLAVASPKHPLARSRSIDVNAFAEAGLILRDDGGAAGSFVERELRLAGVAVRPLLRLNSTEAVKEAVAAGLGVAFVSALAARTDVALRRLAVVNVKGFVIRRPLYRVTRAGAPQSKACTAFLYMLKHAARGSLPNLSTKITPAA